MITKGIIRASGFGARPWLFSQIELEFICMFA